MLGSNKSSQSETQRTGLAIGIAVAVCILAVQSCAPQRPYRRPVPSAAAKPQPTPAPMPSPPSSSPDAEPSSRSLPADPKIREQDLKTNEKVQPSITTSKEIPPPIASPEAAVPAKPPLADDSSLLAKIIPGTPPQRAASLRLSEEGRKLIDSGEYAKALSRLERAIALDSTNAYGHFLLAKTQFGLKRYKDSLNFLEVAESRLGAEPFWLSEVYALKGENFRALGMAERAEESYAQALAINPDNRLAAEALSLKRSETQPAQR
jgi:predicted negative regulator of RcsB-dependent stress response